MNSINIGAQLYTVRDFCKTQEDLEETLKKISEIGFKSIQISGVRDIEPKVIKEYSDKHNLKIVATHIGFNNLLNDTDEVISTHKMYECKYVGIGSMPTEYRSSEKGYIEFAKILNDLGKRLNDSGLQLVYHNHAFEFKKFNNKRGLDILIDETKKDLVQFEIDTYWVQCGGASPHEYIQKLKDRVDVIHLKDMAYDGTNQVMAEIGNGNINFKEVIRLSILSNVKHYIVEQDTCEGSPFDSLKISFDYLNSLKI